MIPIKNIAFLIPVAIFLHCTAVTAQPGVPRDTSFTVYSTFVKESKKRPFISIAQPSMPKGVRKAENVVYASVGQRKLYADVFFPAAKHGIGYPGVIMIFGG